MSIEKSILEDLVAQEESGVESDLELETSGCLEPDEISPDQKMGDPSKKLSEEDLEQSNNKRAEAMRQFAQGNLKTAVELYTDAIELNPTSGLLFAKRGQVYLKLDKPCACIKDCTEALKLNSDSVIGYKYRGRAYRLLGDWKKAATDLRQACSIDLDEEMNDWLKEVTLNAQKIEQHSLKVERKRREKEQKKLTAEIRKTPQHSSEPGADFKPESCNLRKDFCSVLQDPELAAAVSDPEGSAAFADPANFYKYQSNVKVTDLMKKLSDKLADVEVGPDGFSKIPEEFRRAASAIGTEKVKPPSDSEQNDQNLS